MGPDWEASTLGEALCDLFLLLLVCTFPYTYYIGAGKALRKNPILLPKQSEGTSLTLQVFLLLARRGSEYFGVSAQTDLLILVLLFIFTSPREITIVYL